MNILEAIGTPAVLEQLAEECCELGHAALKAARLLRGENPTPALLDEVTLNLAEEAEDVLVVLYVLDVIAECPEIEQSLKLQRWQERLAQDVV